jgi:hypothetical protein
MRKNKIVPFGSAMSIFMKAYKEIGWKLRPACLVAFKQSQRKDRDRCE